mmetsp:Transcript_48207/g.92149  ORF Transcript_48207/g.92149 Transcript_48207/m.92149 type:complete len:123 (+) Transcript_48207:62-430(+)
MSTPEVEWEDQQNINTFGKLNNRLHELRAELVGQKKLAEDYEEAGNELMIADETEVRYVLGECYVVLNNDEAEERCNAALEEVQSTITKLVQEEEDIKQKQSVLKKALYGKFGTNINLEENE